MQAGIVREIGTEGVLGSEIAIEYQVTRRTPGHIGPDGNYVSGKIYLSTSVLRWPLDSSGGKCSVFPAGHPEVGDIVAFGDYGPDGVGHLVRPIVLVGPGVRLTGKVLKKSDHRDDPALLIEGEWGHVWMNIPSVTSWLEIGQTVEMVAVIRDHQSDIRGTVAGPDRDACVITEVA